MVLASVEDGADRGENVRDDVGSSGNSLLAGLAVPDTNGVATDGGLSAEGADVAGVLGDFHLLHLLTERGTVSVGGPSVLPILIIVEIHVRLRRNCSLGIEDVASCSSILIVVPSYRQVLFLL